MKIDHELLHTFVEVVRRRSYTEAGRQLGVSKSMVSRRVVALEAELRCQLLQRNTRSISLTEAGEGFFDRCDDLLRQLGAACDDAAGQGQALAGVVRIAAPQTMDRSLVLPVVAQLMRLHPELDFDVLLDEHRVDLLGEGVDLAIRGGTVPHAALQVCHLACVAGWVVASPAYLHRHGLPKNPADLVSHECLFHAQVPRGAWQFERDSQFPAGEARRVQVNSFYSLLGLALDGVGLAVLPPFLAREPISRGELIRILDDHPILGYPLAAVYPRTRHLSRKVRVTLDTLVRYAARPVVEWGSPA